MSRDTFKQFLIGLQEATDQGKKNCEFIQDPKLRKQCKRLMTRSKGGVRMYGSLGPGATTAGAPSGGGSSGGGGGSGGGGS